ncbi:Calcium and integrin-binding protein 1, partial [Stegodyphus mimosarum]
MIEDHMPELWASPFKDRLRRIFCSRMFLMSFEDFLQMMSIFSDSCPKTIKAEYAFRIYDFDEDGLISDEDIKELLKRLSGDKLRHQEIDQLYQQLLDEGDRDEDGCFNLAEFKDMIENSEDFMCTFRMPMP